MTAPEVAALVLLLVVALAMVLALVRLIVGPSLPDRVVALDLIATAAMVMVALASMAWGVSVLLDVAVATAVITFVGTVAFARFLEAGGRQ
jgi:multicomponent Na+:H+ antiporter subunit F